MAGSGVETGGSGEGWLGQELELVQLPVYVEGVICPPSTLVSVPPTKSRTVQFPPEVLKNLIGVQQIATSTAARESHGYQIATVPRIVAGGGCLIQSFEVLNVHLESIGGERYLFSA